MKLTNEICISFLQGSGWLYNHDKEITISERNKSIDDFAILMKEALNHDWATTKICEQIIYNGLFNKCNEIADKLRK